MGFQQRFDFVIDEFIDKYKLKTIHTHKCLQILSDNELIRYSEAFYRADELRIIADEQTLYEFGQNHSDYDILIKNMIRTYEGIFYKKKVSLHKLAKNYHYNLTELKTMLRNLKKWEIIEYQESTNKPTLEFLINKMNTANIPFDNQQYYDRKKIIATQTESVINFIENDRECRSIQLLNYFGELNSQECEICDVCLSKKAKKLVSKDEYLKIRDSIITQLEKKVFTPIDKLVKLNKPIGEAPVRRVLDRLLELNQIEKGDGEVFRLK